MKRFLTNATNALWVLSPFLVAGIFGSMWFLADRENSRLKRSVAGMENVVRESGDERTAAQVESNKLRAENAELQRKLFAYEAPVAPGAKPETGKPVVDLPQDAENWYATLFVADDYDKRPAHAKAVQMWENEKWCKDLRSRAHGRLFRISDPSAKAYWPHIKGTPCLMLQDPTGLVVYSETNADLGSRPRQLLRSINGTMRKRRHCPDKFCPFIPPDQTKPEDEEEEAEKPKDIPVIKPAEAPKGDPTGAVIGLLVAGVAGFAARFHFASR